MLLRLNEVKNMAMRTLLWYIICIVCIPKSVVCTQICPPTCDCFGTIVDCSNNGLNEIPSDIPDWVEELNLSKNPSLQFGNETFVNLPNLKQLSLEDLQLTEIPELGYLPTLKTLSLAGNSLEKASSSWSGLPILHDLDLSRNFFRHLDLSQLSNTSSLHRIDFKNNLIAFILPTHSASLSLITDLRLPRNQIDDSAFKNLSILFDKMTNLKSLDLNRNLLEKPQALMFQNLTNLTVLKLKRNKIIDLPDGVFYGLNSLTTLRLDNNSNITEVSNGWLFEQRSLRVLSLSHNNVGIINENAWETTKSLAILDMSFNRLGCHHSEPSFKSLNNIQELFLSHNCFATLDKDTFGKLKKLKLLDLSYNQLQSSIEDNTGAFHGLTSLVSLNLAFNKIETIHGKVFQSLASLNSLDLSGNNIKTLTQNPFKNIMHMSKLNFNTSSLVCDCHLAWLPQWLGTKSFNSVKATCGFPALLKGISIFRLTAENFSCDVSPQPIISVSPKNQTVLYGQNMTLECIAFTGGETALFTWTKDRKVVEPFRIKTLMSVEDGNNKSALKVVSQLIVDNVTHDHSGTYQCIARNSFGPSYSPPANIIVHRFPYFTQKLVSVEVKEDGSVDLRCAASGYPPPEILLNKVGDFPAPREKRLHYSPNVYFIKPVLPRDDGIYICTARNEAGSVNVTAKVTVIYTPSFSRPLHNQVAVIGQSIALECQGTGRPKPKVTWFKEKKVLVQDQNHVFVDDGQFLLLLNVEEGDIGTYLCELTNTLGTQRRKINLALKQDVFLPAVTGLIVMIVVICVVLTSFMWVIIIYKMRKRSQRNNYGEGRRALNQIFQEPLNPNQLHSQHLKGEEIPNLAPLFPPSHQMDGYPTTVGHDSGSEHSSGKDSGVGESAQRSNEDLHPNGDIKSGIRRSFLIYPDSPNNLSVKGQSIVAQGKVPADEMRPRLSTFGMQHLDPNKTSGYNPSFASLRRGSASRLLPVPSPVTPGMGMNSLPRHAYRAHSNSFVSHAKLQNDRSASLSRRRPSQSSNHSPIIATNDYDITNVSEVEPLSPASNHDENSSDQRHIVAPTYYNSFHSPERTYKNKRNSLTESPSYLLPTR